MTNEVFNEGQTEVTQEHGEDIQTALTLTLTIIHSKHGAERLYKGRHNWKHLGHNQDTDED